MFRGHVADWRIAHRDRCRSGDRTSDDPRTSILASASEGPRSDPEQHAGHDQPEQHGDDHDRAGQAECANEDGGETGRIARRFDDLDDDGLLRLLGCHSNFQSWLVNASSARVRTATPLGPFGKYGLASSAHAVPAMSRWAHGRPPVNSFRNMAAVIDPAARPPVLVKSAISLLI